MRFILSQDYCWCVTQRERKGLYVVVPLMRMETLGCFISNLVRRLGKSEAGMSCCHYTFPCLNLSSENYRTLYVGSDLKKN